MPNTPQSELTAILQGAAIAPITDRAFLRITGPDATRWLNGMVTNNIKRSRARPRQHTTSCSTPRAASSATAPSIANPAKASQRSYSKPITHSSKLFIKP